MAAIFLNPEGTEALGLDELEGITVENMNDVQRALTLKNFQNLKHSDLASLILKTPRLAYPGDVSGSGLMPKSDHLQNRTPNLTYIPSETQPVTNVQIRKPQQTILEAEPITVDHTVVKQPQFYNSPEVLQTPTLDLPQFVLKDSGEICLPEVEHVEMPQLIQPGQIHAELPQINLAQIDAQMPDINLKSQQIDLPSVNVQKIDTSLPDVNVQGIRHEAFPDINVPKVNANLPDIVLPSAQKIAMPAVNLPEMDHSMPEVNIPVQDQLDLPEVNLAKIDSELPDFKVDLASHANLPSLELPKFKTSIPTFEVKSKQAEKINVIVPRVPIPQLKVKAAPQIEGIDINAFIPSVVTQRGIEGYSDITTLGQKAVAFPNMQGFNPGPAIIPNLLMKGASAAISPQIPMPNISINVPKIEAPAAKLGKIVIEKQMIPIPSVKFPMPNINFHQVAIPKMPHFKACLYDCPDLVVPIPELHKSVVNLVEEKVVEQPVVPKKMVLSYVLIPEKKYKEMKKTAKPLKKIVTQKKVVNKRVITHDLQKYWYKHDLPNEVARAYGIWGKKPVQNLEILKGDYVGTSLSNP